MFLNGAGALDWKVIKNKTIGEICDCESEVLEEIIEVMVHFQQFCHTLIFLAMHHLPTV
jgi:hypothetical protein